MAAAGRLTFLYPQLVRAATRGCSPTLGRATSASASATATTTTNAATTVRWNSLISKRHGKAVEPAEWEKQQQQQLQQQKQQEQDEQTRATQDKTATAGTTEESPAEAQAKSDIGKLYFESGEKKASQAAAADAPETDAAALKSQQQGPKSAQTQAEPKSPEPTSAETEAIPMGPPKPQTDSSDSSSTASAEPKTDKPKDTPKMSDKLDSVYYMGAPESLSSSMPSMSPPKYVHHFDSYSLVKQLQEGGYSSDQATTLMKAVRAILAHNLDIAQEKLVSKSDVENVGALSIPGYSRRRRRKCWSNCSICRSHICSLRRALS